MAPKAIRKATTARPALQKARLKFAGKHKPLGRYNKTCLVIIIIISTT